MTLVNDALPDDDLDGHTMDELVDYLDRSRRPYDPSIENSAACRLALSGLARVSELGSRALRRQADLDPGREDVWISGLLDTIRSEIRSGRDIPVSHPDPTLHLSVTEAALRGAIRRAGDTMSGIIMGRCTLEGDIDSPADPIRVEVTCVVEYGTSIPSVVELLRGRIVDTVARHTDLVVHEIDITVDDIYVRGESAS